MIPLLTRIEQELSVCTDPLRQAELLAERACYLARTGDFAGANEIAASLRQAYGDGRSARISVWIMLIEGLVLYFDKLSSSLARDRIVRANVISSVAAIPRLKSLTAAWLAHIEFERSAYESMAALIASVLRSAEPDAFDVHSRVGMILGDAYLYSGNRSQSMKWYEYSRRHSILIGDRAAIGALMYNRSAFGLALARIKYHTDAGFIDQQHLSFIEIEMESGWSFQSGTKVTALSHLVDLCRARVEILRGRHSSAIDLLLPLNERLVSIEDRQNRSCVLADLAWCLFKIDRHDQAVDMVRQLDEQQFLQLDADDQVVAIAICLHISEFVGDQERIDAFRKGLVGAEFRLSQEINCLQLALASIEAVVPPDWH